MFSRRSNFRHKSHCYLEKEISMRTLLILVAILLGASSAASAAAVDSGKNAYAANCASCHGVRSSAWPVSAPSIQNAIQSNRGGMGKLASLTAAELQDIATYLADPAATAVATTDTTQPVPAPVPLAAATDSDRIFDWAESAYPQWFGSHSSSQNVAGYYLRHYPGTDVYLATLNGRLYFYNTGRPQDGMLELGLVSDWLNRLTPAANPQKVSNGGDNGVEGGYGDNDGYDNDGHDNHHDVEGDSD